LSFKNTISLIYLVLGDDSGLFFIAEFLTDGNYDIGYDYDGVYGVIIMILVDKGSNG
jgi:hypothetical protein